MLLKLLVMTSCSNSECLLVYCSVEPRGQVTGWTLSRMLNSSCLWSFYLSTDVSCSLLNLSLNQVTQAFWTPRLTSEKHDDWITSDILRHVPGWVEFPGC